jgi:hypothetical protein
MENFRFITCSFEKVETYVVLSSKVEDFCQDMKANGYSGQIHINYAELCLNGSIGRGNYITTINI